MKGCVKHIHNFWPEMASWPGMWPEMAFRTEIYFWLEMAFQPEMVFGPEMAFQLEMFFWPKMAFQPEMAFCQILSQENCTTIILFSNKSALLLKVLKGLARL